VGLCFVEQARQQAVQNPQLQTRRSRQCHRESARSGADGGEVREVRHQGPAPNAAGALSRPAEVDTLDEAIRRDHPVLVGRRAQYGRVITDPDHHTARPAPLAGSAFDPLDESKFAEIPKLHWAQRSRTGGRPRREAS